MQNTPISSALMRPITILGLPMAAICIEMLTLPIFLAFSASLLLTAGIYACLHFGLYIAYKVDPTIFTVLAANLRIKPAGNKRYWQGDSYGPW